jgi:hypothetical protein
MLPTHATRVNNVYLPVSLSLQILRVLSDDRWDLVLTPQYFTNITPYADAFNHLNPQFW